MNNRTSFTRRVDRIGRTSIPKEICRKLDIQPEDNFDVFLSGSDIIFRKHERPEVLSALMVLSDEIKNNVSDLKKQLEAEKAMRLLRRILTEKED